MKVRTSEKIKVGISMKMKVGTSEQIVFQNEFPCRGTGFPDETAEAGQVAIWPVKFACAVRVLNWPATAGLLTYLPS